MNRIVMAVYIFLLKFSLSIHSATETVCTKTMLHPKIRPSAITRLKAGISRAPSPIQVIEFPATSLTKKYAIYPDTNLTPFSIADSPDVNVYSNSVTLPCWALQPSYNPLFPLTLTFTIPDDMDITLPSFFEIHIYITLPFGFFTPDEAAFDNGSLFFTPPLFPTIGIFDNLPGRYVNLQLIYDLVDINGIFGDINTGSFENILISGDIDVTVPPNPINFQVKHIVYTFQVPVTNVAPEKVMYVTLERITPLFPEDIEFPNNIYVGLIVFKYSKLQI